MNYIAFERDILSSVLHSMCLTDFYITKQLNVPKNTCRLLFSHFDDGAP